MAAAILIGGRTPADRSAEIYNATLRDVRRMLCEQKRGPTAVPESLESRPATLEERLWASWRRAPRPKPAVKELKESFAFFKKAADPLVKASRAIVDKPDDDEPAASTTTLRAVDCCGGHGVLAMLMVAYRKCDDAVVVDLMQPASFGNLRLAWARDGMLGPRGVDSVGFIQEDIAVGLPIALGIGGVAAESSMRRKCVVMACHACQFLTAEIVEECTRLDRFHRGSCVPVAVMSCCPKDETGGRLLSAAKALKVSLGYVVL